MATLDDYADFEKRQKRGAEYLDKKGNGKGGPVIIIPEEEEDRALPAPPDGLAYHGLAGEIANFIVQESEADPAALLVQTLVAFGCLCGRGAYYQVGATKHYPNLFTLLVGSTSKARKGTSWDLVESIFKDWVAEWVNVSEGGLSSGEGLKYQVRDARERKKKRGVKRHWQDPEFEEEESEEEYLGVTDKRLLVVEPEFATVLRVLTRSGSTLSATLRQVYDTGNLRVCTRRDPIKATGAHIGAVAHVTDQELRKELTQTDMANGLINRFLVCCVRRSKLLPMGGNDLDKGMMSKFAQRLSENAGLAKGVGRVRMDKDAQDHWVKVYPELSEGKPGLVGAMLARAEAHAVRWGMVYALMDGKAEIGVEHLEAALELVGYSERSVRYVYPGEGVEQNPVISDVRMKALRGMLREAGPEGLPTKAISDLFQRNVPSGELREMLLAYVQAGFVVTEIDRETGGRPATRWIWRCRG
jgi:hypothetical protein